MGFLCRAFVYLPNHLRTPERAERTVFFDVPARTILRAEQYRHLAKLLALVWDAPVDAMLEEGVIYNLVAERDLLNDHAMGAIETGDLRLLEIAWGGSDGIGPQHIHYQRREHIDILCAPRNTQRLQKALAQVEALYATKGGAA
jgi:hypothetical protein